MPSLPENSRAAAAVVVVRTGTANLASVLAGLRRAGAAPHVSSNAAEIGSAERLVLPGVGAFGAAMQRLVAAGLVDVLAERVRAGRPLLAICLGLQLLCESSAESPGVRGLGVVPGRVTRFDTGLRVPQLGWNFIKPEPACSLLTSGHAYFANSYRLTDTPAGWSAASAEYGGPFVAAFERGSVLACQFHPELSGRWGLQLLRRWLEIGENSEAAAIGGAASAACLGGAPTSVASSSPASARLSTGAAPC